MLGNGVRRVYTFNRSDFEKEARASAGARGGDEEGEEAQRERGFHRRWVPL
jgi:hypothetical protein